MGAPSGPSVSVGIVCSISRRGRENGSRDRAPASRPARIADANCAPSQSGAVAAQGDAGQVQVCAGVHPTPDLRRAASETKATLPPALKCHARSIERPHGLTERRSRSRRQRHFHQRRVGDAPSETRAGSPEASAASLGKRSRPASARRLSRDIASSAAARPGQPCEHAVFVRAAMSSASNSNRELAASVRISHGGFQRRRGQPQRERRSRLAETP